MDHFWPPLPEVGIANGLSLVVVPAKIDCCCSDFCSMRFGSAHSRPRQNQTGNCETTADRDFPSVSAVLESALTHDGSAGQDSRLFLRDFNRNCLSKSIGNSRLRGCGLLGVGKATAAEASEEDEIAPTTKPCASI